MLLESVEYIPGGALMENACLTTLTQLSHNPHSHVCETHVHGTHTHVSGSCVGVG
jgi:hypothetical protein